jgi:aspartyl-tRNA(Asn)/glutamyl-tRNA(Gln) amidotransferase subunit C
MSNDRTFDRSTVEHVAKLAALSLSSEEAERFTHELAAIVAHVDELAALDTSEVPPTYQVCVPKSGLRPDVVAPSLSNEEALSQAPRQGHGGFAVPVFVEG